MSEITDRKTEHVALVETSIQHRNGIPQLTAEFVE